jgi:hypothetical protein
VSFLESQLLLKLQGAQRRNGLEAKGGFEIFWDEVRGWPPQAVRTSGLTPSD